MLHRTLLLLSGILLFSATASAFQRDYNISLDSNLAGYFRYVNLAARAIYRNDFVAAASYYEEAFKRKSNPFFVDLKNAILVNGKCGLYSKNEPLLRILINDKQIDADRLLADLPPRVFDSNNLEFIRALQQAKASNKKKPNVLETEIRKLFAADQQILAYENIYSDKECRDSANNANALKFIDLYRKLGFPSEEKLAVYYDDESSWSEILFTLLTTLLDIFHAKAQKPKTQRRKILIFNTLLLCENFASLREIKMSSSVISANQYVPKFSPRLCRNYYVWSSNCKPVLFSCPLGLNL